VTTTKWYVVSSPNGPGSVNELQSVAAVSPQDAWAVGHSYDPSAKLNQALIEHWDGTHWSVVASPTLWSGELHGVAALSAGDVWAVGEYMSNSTSGTLTLIEHWDGTSWSQVPSPVLSGANASQLNGVAAVSPSDVWAVGVSYVGIFATTHEVTLFEHWNGTSWRMVDSADFHPPPTYYLTGVAAVSGGDVWHSEIWAVGYTADLPYSNNFPRQTLIEHWDGTSWRVVPSPNLGTNDNYVGPDDNQLLGVAADSPTDVWAVGGSVRTLIEHWDGTSWSIVPSPNHTGAAGDQLTGVAAISPSDVWAVGHSTGVSGKGIVQTLIEHWDGTSWSIVPSPNQGPDNNRLLGVAAVSHHGVWAVGGYGNPIVGPETTLVMRYGSPNAVPTNRVPRLEPTVTPLVPPTVTATATPHKAPATPSVHEVAQTTTLLGGDTGPALATCPAGERALGGGWSVPTSQARVFAARRTGDAWSVSVQPLGHPASTTITVYVECLANAPGAVVTERAASGSVPANTSGVVVATCNSGETLVGGGFDLSAAPTTLELRTDAPQTPESGVLWASAAMNHDPALVAHPVTAYAECLAHVSATPTYPGQQGSYVYAGQTGEIAVACPSGAVPAGGGLDYTAASLGNLYQLQATATGWHGAIYGVTGNGLIPLVPTAWGVCLHFAVQP
jgi:hypothetical protein